MRARGPHTLTPPQSDPAVTRGGRQWGFVRIFGHPFTAPTLHPHILSLKRDNLDGHGFIRGDILSQMQTTEMEQQV